MSAEVVEARNEVQVLNSGARQRRPWYRRAFETVITGILFGVFVSVALGLFANLPVAVALQAWGADAGQRLQEIVSRSLGPRASEGELRFSVINLSGTACHLSLGFDECRDPVIPPAELIAPMLRAVLAAGPRLVVIDVALPHETLMQLQDAVNSSGGGATSVPVVIPFPSRPLTRAQHVLSIAPEADRTRAPWLHEASFAVWTDASFPDAIRGYPARVWVHSQDSGNVRPLASAPLAATLLLDDPSGKLLGCVNTPSPTTACDFDAGQSAFARLAVQSAEPKLDSAIDTFSNGHLLFTVPSWLSYDAVGDLVSNTAIEDRYDTIVRFFEASDLIESDTVSPRFAIPERQLEDTVVIIGNGDEAAGDFHRTPLGVMQGWQVLMNAIRAYHLLGPIDRAPVSPFSPDAILTILLTAAVLLVVEGGKEAALDLIASRLGRRRKWPYVVGRAVLTTACFTTAIAISSVVSIYLQAIILYFSSNGGQVYREADFLLPMIAVLLGSWVEIASVVLNRIQLLVGLLANATSSLGTSLYRKTKVRITSMFTGG